MKSWPQVCNKRQVLSTSKTFRLESRGRKNNYPNKLAKIEINGYGVMMFNLHSGLSNSIQKIFARSKSTNE